MITIPERENFTPIVGDLQLKPPVVRECEDPAVDEDIISMPFIPVTKTELSRGRVSFVVKQDTEDHSQTYVGDDEDIISMPFVPTKKPRRSSLKKRETEEFSQTYVGDDEDIISMPFETLHNSLPSRPKDLMSRSITMSCLYEINDAIAKKVQDEFCNTKAKSIFESEQRQMRSSRFSRNKFELSMRKLFQDDDEGTQTTSSLLIFPEEASAEIGKKKEVRFGEVHIQEYPLIVGVNPVGLRGVPITIDWSPVSSISCAFDKYEVARAGHRRPMRQLRMSWSHRERCLKELGFSRMEINRGLKGANIVRHQRKHTQQTMKYSKTHERIEKLGRILREIITFGSGLRAEKKLLKQQLRSTVH